MSSECTPVDTIPASAEYYNLGTFHRPISTESRDAQTWFDRGLLWAYAFNHEESIRCFSQVIAHDPTCAIGYWGFAYAKGPNYNKKWSLFDRADLEGSFKTCYQMVEAAKKHLSRASAVEKALILAMEHRYPSEHVSEDLMVPTWAYAKAMKNVYDEFGDGDMDVVTLVADALMMTHPRNLYMKNTGRPNLETPVLDVKAILETGLKDPNSRRHVGLLHLYIHLMEMSSTPEVAIIPADQLRSLAPDGGHAHHMPSHIDVLIGDYRRAIDTNLKATAADDKYYAKEGPCNFYSLYRLHNYHSLVYAAMLAGQSHVALESVDRMEATITDEMLLIQSPPMADWLEFFNSVRTHVYIRFGMWSELKGQPVPDDRELYCGTVAMVYYGRALAYAATGLINESLSAREDFLAAAKQVPSSRMIFPNTVVDVLGVAAAMLDGELEYRRGNYELAFSHLRLAVSRDDALEYAEPWAWMLPTRHAYAALLLEQGDVERAAIAYAEDLGLDQKLVRVHQHPNNVWALHGYHECMTRLGRSVEASLIKKHLAVAAAGADVRVNCSCFCRLEACPIEPTSCCDGCY